MPRPIPPGGRRDIRLQIFVNGDEWQAIEAEAEKLGITYAQYVRQRLFGKVTK